MKRLLTSGAVAVLTALSMLAGTATSHAEPKAMLVGTGSGVSHPLDQDPAPSFRIGRSPLPLKLKPIAPLVPPAPGEINEFEQVWCENCVAITYDDGPVPNTNVLLDVLKKKRVHASFFLIGGNAQAYPEIVKRLHNEGHDIGNHTLSHPQLTALSNARVAYEIDSTNTAIKEAGGRYPKWMRPPYGATNNRVASVIGSRDQAVALWDVDTVDWRHRSTAKTCSIAVANAQAGSIILMHDIHPSTVNAAECIIDGLRAKGLHPVSLAELFEAPKAGVTYNSANDGSHH
ncbi:polysaccharide deacetylase family protein [Corynebacterium meitnerae]|uniref:Polysaccharide deacetylase family protein n=1 Tax=Corynebacterium meitnerae TaxID=2913498 RepID=A0A9X3RJF5_9CORY|nr:polysaccharide deacetylase family protein [Corynebacterium meitnerae]MCZ9293091.1 polysaccharide deacetylase family protein [Corynebacterium meitnerae]